MSVVMLKNGVLHASVQKKLDSDEEVDLLLSGVVITQADNSYDAKSQTTILSAPLPEASINSGIQTYIFQARKSGEILASYSIACGEEIEADLISKLDLMRAELDLLKRIVFELKHKSES